MRGVDNRGCGNHRQTPVYSSKRQDILPISPYVTQTVYQMSLERKNSQATLQGIGGA